MPKTKTNFILTDENYHTPEANKLYLGSSQFKDFVNVSGFKNDACEARAMAKLKGEWVEEPSTAMLQGSYVDSYFEGTISTFIEKNPDIFTKISASKLKTIEYVESYFNGKMPIFEASNPDFFNKNGTIKKANEHVDQIIHTILNTCGEDIDKFKLENPSILSKNGELKGEYKKAEEVIQRIERDEFFMKHLEGEKQVIMTANFFGADWKIKIDSYFEDKAIIDLKVIKDIHEKFWCPDTKEYVSFVQRWGYDVQGAIYQKVVEINTGKKLPFFLAVADKGKFSDIEIINIPNERLDEVLSMMSSEVKSILNIKNGHYEPMRCEKCDYCKHTKVLTKDISYLDLIL